MDVNTRVRRAAVALGVSLLVLVSGATQLPGPAIASPDSSASNAEQPYLWVADDTHLVRVPLNGNQDGPQVVAALQSPTAIAADPLDGLVWIYQQRHVLALDERGQTTADVDLSSQVPAPTHVALVVDARRGAVWLGLDKTLMRLDIVSQQLRQIRLPDSIQALSLDPIHARVWASTGHALVAYDAAGAVAQTVARDRPINAMAFDPTASTLWVADGEAIHQYPQDGRPALDVPLEGIDVRRLTPDGFGGVWAAGTSVAAHLDARGFVLDRVAPETFDVRNEGNAADAIVDVVVDPTSGEALIVGHHHVYRTLNDGLVHLVLDARQWPQLHAIELAAPHATGFLANSNTRGHGATYGAEPRSIATLSKSSMPLRTVAAASSSLEQPAKLASSPACDTTTCQASTDLTQHEARALWVAAQRDLYKVAPDSGAAAALAVLRHPQALAVDALHDVLWVYRQGSLDAFDAAGKNVVDVALPRNVEHGDHPRLAVDGASGVVWLAMGPTLHRMDQKGQWQASYRLRHEIQALALDTKRAWLWVAQDGTIAAFDNSGHQQLERTLERRAPSLALAYDAKLDQLWLMDDHGLTRLAADGTATLAAKVKGDLTNSIAADGAGGLWAAGEGALAHFDGAGVQQFVLVPLVRNEPRQPVEQGVLGRIADQWNDWWRGEGNEDRITAIVADPLNHSAWVAGRRYVVQIGVDAKRLQWLDSRSWTPNRENQPDSHDQGQHEGEGQGIHGIALYVDTAPPTLSLSAPTDGDYSNDNRPTLALQYSDIGSGVDPGSVAVTSDGATIPVACQTSDGGAQCTPNTALPDGKHVLSATVKDYAGNASSPASVTITVDTVPPSITLTSPTTTLTNDPNVTLAGSVSETASLTVNDISVPIAADLHFSLASTLKEGSNAYTLKADDRAGNEGIQVLSITLDTLPPAQPNLGAVSVAGPDGGKVTITGGPGSVEGGATVVLTNTVTGASVSVQAAADGSFTATLEAGPSDPISILVRDAAGNVTQAPTTIEATNLPPDPVTVAPKLLPTVAAPFQDQVSFLYSGAQPIQTGVAPGTISPLRVAVVRGQVFDRADQPLGGITVTVLDHPEYGQTLTRADGCFDLAVNGGGSVVVNFAAQGYLTAQRTVEVPWRDFAVAQPLVMVAPDPVATPVTFSSTIAQIAHSSVQTDESGSRRATLLIPAGTAASAIMPDGTARPITAAHLHATEFTVGANGPSAMPAALPPASAYTYAVDLSLDEAQAAGATTVQFSRTVPVYVDNFLNVAPGTPVPAGYYDPKTGAWKASLDGIAVKLLGVQASTGLAQLDLDGSGNPASATLLATYGIDDTELTAIGKTFAPGHSFWRMPVNHFTYWDFNFGYNPQAGYLMPPPPQPKPHPPTTQRDSGDDHTCHGCEIDAENQRVGETIPVVGTPYALHYESSSPASLDQRTLTFPVTTATPPTASLLSTIRVTVAIAGRTIERNFDPSVPNQTFSWTWDGINAYGQHVYTPTQATIYLAYIYKLSYGAFINGTSGAGQSFGRPANAVMQGFAHVGDTVAATRQWTEVLSPGVESALGADRWTLNVVHAFDSYRHILYKGDGTIRSAQDYGDVGIATNFAGQGSGHIGAGGDGGPATQATLFDPAIVKAAPDGSVYIWDSVELCIRKVDPQGIISTFAGICGRAPYGQNFSSTPTLATSIPIRLDQMAVGPGGDLYINSYNGIVRITPDGMGTLIAGGGTAHLVDGHASAGAYISGLFVIAPDRTIYFANGNYNFGTYGLWKVDPSGVLHLLLGGGFGYGINGLALAKNGDVVFGDSTELLGEIKELTPQGRLIKLAGYGSGGPYYSPNPSLGLGTYIPEADGMARGPDGSLYHMGDTGQIVKLDPQGWVRCVVGCSNVRYRGNAPFPTGGLPAQSVIDHTCCQPNSFDVGPDGSIYLPELYDARVLRISPVLPNLSLGSSFVASEDGRQLFVFNEGGQHIETLDAITGNPVYTFHYDVSGLLTSLTDSAGRTTTIERTGQGEPTAITAPDGQITQLTVDQHQRLVSVADPAGDAYSMAYDETSGQLTSYTDPRGHADQYTYDTNGFLTKNVNAGGGGWTLVRTGSSDQSDPYTVAMTSAMGLTYRYAVSIQSDGSNLDLATAPDGTQSSLIVAQGGTRTMKAADGTVTTIQETADPRFGMQSPLAASVTIKTPSGLTWTGSQTRTATLQSPSSLLSLSSFQETATVNGNTTKRQFDPATRTWTTTTAAGRSSTITVDSLDRPLTLAVPGVAPVTMSYDEAGHLRSAGMSDGVTSRTTSYQYYASGPAKGWLQSVTDPLGRTVSYQYDAAGRVTAKLLPNGEQIRYSYDANGNLTSLTPAGRQAHGFTYTDVDQAATYTPPALPDTGVTTTQYQYDKDRRITQISRPDGATVSLGYGASGHLERLTTPDWTYQFGYDGKTGQLISILAPGNEALGLAWDGALLTGTRWNGTVSGNVTRTYDANFRISAVAVNGQNVAYSYDADGLMAAAGDLVVSRDASNGRITGTALGSLQTAQTFNAFGELGSLEANYAGTGLYSVDYQRDAAGNIVRQLETVAGVAHTYEYTYDNQGRLVDVRQDGRDLGAYGYDANGNRVSIGGQTVAQYDDQDRLLAWAGNTYSYTANGALASATNPAGITQYTYDVLGNLREVKQPGALDIQYIVDGNNRRIGKKTNGTLVQGFLYQDSLRPVAELDGSGRVVTRFVYATRTNVPDYMVKDGKTYRIVADKLGSPRLVVDTSTGQVVERLDFDVWGSVTTDSNPGFQPFGFAGGLYDRDTGLIHFGARDYNPETGRWTAKDPIGFKGGDTNIYAYVANNPLGSIDPYGLSSLIYNPSTHTLTVVNGSGQALQSFDAGNNAQRSSRGPWEPGTYAYGYHTSHPGDAPNSPFGSHGNFVFNVPGCIGCGVHSGRANSTDLAGRSGVNFATNGCIRTTDDATDLISELTAADDPLSGLIVTSNPPPTNLPPFDSSLTGGPMTYPPDM